MSEFTDYLQDVFSTFGHISVRKMFGGHGIYFDDCMFGLVADDMLYLKVDSENIQHFEALDLPAFEYTKSDGRPMKMSFYLAPESIYEEQEEAREWAAHAWEAARRAKAQKRVAGKRATKKKSAKKRASDSTAITKQLVSKKVAAKGTNKGTKKVANKVVKKVAKKITKKVTKKATGKKST